MPDWTVIHPLQLPALLLRRVRNLWALCHPFCNLTLTHLFSFHMFTYPGYWQIHTGGDLADGAGDYQFLSYPQSPQQPSSSLLPPLPERGVWALPDTPLSHGPHSKHWDSELSGSDVFMSSFILLTVFELTGDCLLFNKVGEEWPLPLLLGLCLGNHHTSFKVLAKE